MKRTKRYSTLFRIRHLSYIYIGDLNAVWPYNVLRWQPINKAALYFSQTSLASVRASPSALHAPDNSITGSRQFSNSASIFFFFEKNIPVSPGLVCFRSPFAGTGSARESTCSSPLKRPTPPLFPIYNLTRWMYYVVNGYFQIIKNSARFITAVGSNDRQMTSSSGSACSVT